MKAKRVWEFVGYPNEHSHDRFSERVPAFSETQARKLLRLRLERRYPGTRIFPRIEDFKILGLAPKPTPAQPNLPFGGARREAR